MAPSSRRPHRSFLSVALGAAVLFSDALIFSVYGFAPRPPSSCRTPTTTTRLQGRIEQIEFKIYSDGRVEEVVRGVKGENCQGVTETINEALGEVILSNPTEEMFEQDVVIDQTLTESVGDSWEGKSSW